MSTTLAFVLPSYPHHCLPQTCSLITLQSVERRQAKYWDDVHDTYNYGVTNGASNLLSFIQTPLRNILLFFFFSYFILLQYLFFLVFLEEKKTKKRRRRRKRRRWRTRRNSISLKFLSLSTFWYNSFCVSLFRNNGYYVFFFLLVWPCINFLLCIFSFIQSSS